MSLLTSMKYSFQSQAYPEDTFTVIDFHGTEGLSGYYWFEINLVTQNQDIDMGEVLEHTAVFTIHREGGNVPFHGILAKMEVRQAYRDYVFYKAVLAPRFWWLTLTHHNQVFLNQSVPDIIKAVLEDGGLTAQDYELRLENDYSTWEYLCQYRESHFDFVSRWMEREGMYYFFEQTDAAEKLVITDTKLAHTAMPLGQSIIYSQPSGLETGHLDEVVQFLVCSQTTMPQRVLVKDYNYQTPNLDLSGQADVSPKHGRGEFYYYGDHFRTPAEGTQLATIRAESILCGKQIFSGVSRIPYLRPGYTFDMTDHFKDGFNQSYLTISLEHRGSQAGYLVEGLVQAANPKGTRPFYSNNFKAIPAKTQFRAEIVTPKPRFYGTMTARIDASGSGQYAELDAQGRYKAILPFDLSGRSGGQASAWIRMMQPYGGSAHGMHFPLHKGTEVLLTFMDGDPDRPVIAGAVPNPENPSLLSSNNAANCAMQSSSGNQLIMGDQQGQEFMGLYSPHNHTAIGIGAVKKAGGKPEGEGKPEGGGESGEKETSWIEYTLGSKDGYVLGDSSDVVGGTENKVVIGVKNDLCAGISAGLKAGLSYEFSLSRNFAFEGGNTLSMGEGSSASVDDDRSIAAVKGVTIEAVQDLVTKELYEKAMQAAKLAAAASATLAASTSLLGHEFGSHDSQPWLADKSSGLKDGVAAVGAVGLAASVAMLTKSHLVLDKIHNTMKSWPRAVKLTLDEDGMNAKCIKMAGLTSQPTINLTCIGAPILPAPTAGLKMDEKSIKLTGATTGATGPQDFEVTADTTGGVKIATSDTNSGININCGTQSKVALSKTGVSLNSTDGFALSCQKATATITSQSQASVLQMTNTKSSLQYNINMVTCDASGVKVNIDFAGGRFVAGQLNCVGQQLVKIG